MRFVRPDGGSLRLVYGAPSLPAPRYDLALLAPQLLGAAAHEVDAAPEEGPSDAQTAREGRAFDERVFWIVLVAAVVVLAFVLVRLLRTPVAS